MVTNRCWRKGVGDVTRVERVRQDVTGSGSFIDFIVDPYKSKGPVKPGRLLA